MQQQSPFKIFNASAGSGKTFSLVKNYLKILLSSAQRDPFKFVLALTFTNKAVGEMKERIINTLKEFSNSEIIKTPSDMFILISEELNIPPETIHYKSKQLLHSILHNYAAFDISTIDRFNHKIIRAFAHDLKLPLNFEVELDVSSFLSEAVDSLIAKAGNDNLLTKTLIDYAISKADDDKSWNISKDLNDIASILLQDNEKDYLWSLKDKTLKDFSDFKSSITEKIAVTENEIVKNSLDILQKIESSSLKFNDFSNSYLPKHFQKLATKKFDINFSSKWQENIESKSLFPKKASEEAKATINSLQPLIAETFNTTKGLVFLYRFLISINKNSTQLSVLNLINNELTQLKEDKNALFISDFNTLIGNEIKNQPTPFIYERLGEKFKHYFIDEFQDTSVVQWENLIPLLSNNLSDQTGTAMLVGDAKQAIYRWRGGEAEQFLGLTLTDNPFQSPKTVEHLEKNYRSHTTIVNFNNLFFNYLSTTGFRHDTYSKLYEQAKQEPNNLKEGYVEIEFLDIDSNKEELYPEKVYEKIVSCKNLGYTLTDICVLVRKKKEASQIAEYLSNKDITVSSFEAMLLINSPEVNAVNTTLKILLNPDEKEQKIKLLQFLAEHYAIEDKHDFFKTRIDLKIDDFFTSFKDIDIHITAKELLQLSIYELAETIIRDLKLIKNQNAYLQYYLDVVFDYSLKHASSISEFIDYFEKNENKFNIITPEDLNAVKIMTIHKSKGLEFPVVIFPYAELDIYKELNPKVWYPLNQEEYANFPYALLNYNKDIEHFGEIGKNLYQHHQSELELDNINLLYVTLTRPIEQLYIIGKKDISSKGIVNPKTYSGMLINFLKSDKKWEDDKLIYHYGDNLKRTKEKSIENNTELLKKFISYPKESHNIKIVTNSGYLWDTNQEKAIEKGNLIHKIMAGIKTKNDVDFVLTEFFLENIINSEQKSALKKTVLELVNHPKLETFFTENFKIYTEESILSKSGVTLRPDRLNINSNNEIVIIDYKTGDFQPKYSHQLQDYQDILEQMNYKIIHKILVFINDDVKIEIL